jgi:TatA/E family protein of Tat protein translocase
LPNIGLPEIIIVLVIALVVFGPKRLPEMGRQIGKAMREFRSATSEIRTQIGVDDISDTVKDIRSDLSVTGGDKPVDAAAPGAPAPAGDDGGSAGEAAAAAKDVAHYVTPGTSEPAHYIAPGITTADVDVAASPDENGAAADASAPADEPEADPDAAVTTPAGEAGDDVGVEAFGSLTRRSARPSAG